MFFSWSPYLLIPEQPLIWEVSAAFVAKGEKQRWLMQQLTKLPLGSDICHFLLFKWTKQVTWPGCSSGATEKRYFFPEWMDLTSVSTSATEILSSEVASFSNVSRNTSSQIPSHSDMGYQGYGMRDKEKCFSRDSVNHKKICSDLQVAPCLRFAGCSQALCICLHSLHLCVYLWGPASE